MTDETFVIALDGITVQHAGELLYDTSVDSSVRSICSDSYMQSLGDVTFALLCGQRFATTALLPPDPNRPGGRAAGDIVKEEFKDRLIEIPVITPPVHILQDPARAQAVEKDIASLLKAFERKRWAWEDYMRRDAALYMGQDQNLQFDNLDPEKYVFAAAHYVAKPELQRLIPEEYIGKLVPIVQSAVNNVSYTAAREFITRATVTHILFYWDNESKAEDIVQTGGIRLPHITRASLRMEQAKKLSVKRLRNAVVPSALNYVLKGAQKRQDVIDRLLDLYNVKLFRKVRGIFQDALVESDHGNERKLDKLLDEVSSLAAESGSIPDRIVMKPKFEIDVLGVAKVGLELGWDNVFKGRRYWMRQFIQAGAGDDWRERAFKIFPEFEQKK